MKFKLRPEFNWRYWLHIPIIGFVILGILQLILGSNMLSVTNLLWSIPLIALGDIVAHTLLRFD